MNDEHCVKNHGNKKFLSITIAQSKLCDHLPEYVGRDSAQLGFLLMLRALLAFTCVSSPQHDSFTLIMFTLVPHIFYALLALPCIYHNVLQMHRTILKHILSLDQVK